MSRFIIIVEGLLALSFAALALALLWRPSSIPSLPSVGIAQYVSVGVVAVAALLLLMATKVPFVAFFAGAFATLSAAVIGIFGATHDLAIALPVAGVLALGSIAIASLQPLGLRVLAMPRAAKLPFEPVAQAWVVKTYDEGVWFESVRAGTDGTLYLAANIGLDFNRSDYYRSAHGEVIARRHDGSEQVLFRTPMGSTAGVFAVADDGTLYMSSNGFEPGIWRITPNGHGTMLAPLPRGAWPNGLDFGPDGKLYSPDSLMGLVWRIDPVTGHADVAIRHRALSARPFVAIAPGANGLHFIGHDLLVTVSDSGEILRFVMDDAGRFSEPHILATGIPGDDFAVGPDGSLFVTTHPYDTLVRVEPDGRRTIIADARQRIIGATDATFGRTDADRDILYVATDGGAFTGGPKTRGELVALRPYAA